MSPDAQAIHIGYVVKRYPRFSETFIVNEILAHERAGVPVSIFAVRRVNEPYFQSILGQVRSPVTYISDSTPKADSVWLALKDGARALPDFWASFEAVQGEDMADVLQAIRLAIAAREAGVTHLHAHFATVATVVARLAARFSGIGYSFTAHAKDIFHEAVDADILRRKLADASAAVTVSDFNMAWLGERFAAAAAKVTRIYNGLEIAEFPYRAPLGRQRLIVAVGRLVEKKGFDVLIEACALLKARGVTFECEIIGGGQLSETLRALVSWLDLDDCVTLPGALPRPEVVAALHRAAVSVMPCVIAEDGDRDGLPTVLIEAMALGTPCIATDVTGIPEIVRDGETGLCVAQRDPVALADAIERLLGDEVLGQRLAEAARALIEAEFDVDRNAGALRELFSWRGANVEAGLRVVG